MKLKTSQITQTALLLAICIVSQFFKNASVYITGPIINTVLLTALLFVNLPAALILSVLTPVTAFFITGSPIMAAIPLMFPVIMCGNIILVLSTWIFYKKNKKNLYLYIGMFTGSILKALFMWIMTSFVLFPIFSHHLASFLPKPAALPQILATAKITFSITQFITAVIGCVLAAIIMLPLRKYLKNQN